MHEGGFGRRVQGRGRHRPRHPTIVRRYEQAGDDPQRGASSVECLPGAPRSAPWVWRIWISSSCLTRCGAAHGSTPWKSPKGWTGESRGRGGSVMKRTTRSSGWRSLPDTTSPITGHNSPCTFGWRGSYLLGTSIDHDRRCRVDLESPEMVERQPGGSSVQRVDGYRAKSQLVPAGGCFHPRGCPGRVADSRATSPTDGSGSVVPASDHTASVGPPHRD